ncbi:MAG: prepilin-type N-terminal cleavage/methylation domain-containing protein [Rickettsiales bacterium]
MRQGLSLIEICIVLVIIGLVAGGVITGQSMIRNAKIRSLITQSNTYNTAVGTFKQKYKALPGDMKNAVRYWGARAGGTADGPDATCKSYFDATHTTTKLTCNGDGDGKIEYTSTDWSEPWAAWQHLADAGMIPGQYTGQGTNAAGGVDDAKPGYNCPNSGFRDACFAYTYRGTVSNTNTDWFEGMYGHVMRIGIFAEVDGTYLTPAEMLELDTKIDDGLPALGNIRAYKNFKRPNCTTSDLVTAAYKLTYEDLGCNIIYLTGF